MRVALAQGLPGAWQAVDRARQRQKEQEPQLRKEVSLLDATAMTIGSIIGSGIFSAPGVALAEPNSVGCSLAAWTSSCARSTAGSPRRRRR